MKRLITVCVVVLMLDSAQVLGVGDDQHHAGRAASFGKPGDPAKVSHTIAVDMTDAMRFIPASITVKKGETIRFVVKNSGRLKHEMVLGTAKAVARTRRAHEKVPRDGTRGLESGEFGRGKDRRADLAVHPGRHVRLRLSAARPFRCRHARHNHSELILPPRMLRFYFTEGECNALRYSPNRSCGLGNCIDTDWC
jgi:uncharacterized cupredoxin-like copper-binding protein